MMTSQLHINVRNKLVKTKKYFFCPLTILKNALALEFRDETVVDETLRIVCARIARSRPYDGINDGEQASSVSRR